MQPALTPASGCILRDTILHLSPLEKLELFNVVYATKSSDLQSHAERLALHIMLRHAATLLAPATPILPVLRLLCQLKDTRPSFVLHMLNTDERCLLVRLAQLSDPVNMAEASHLLEQAGLDPITHQRWFDAHHCVRPLHLDRSASSPSERRSSMTAVDDHADADVGPIDKLTSTRAVRGPCAGHLVMFVSLAIAVLILLYVWIRFNHGHGYFQ
jgi:hypothetical protein